MKAERDVIAIDGDGVLFDYHLGYKAAWKKAFGEDLQEVRPDAYFAWQRWGARRLTDPAEIAHLKTAFDADFWATLPAMPGAIQACIELEAAGHELVCLTALGHRFENDRLENLRWLGFPVHRVIATGDGWDMANTLSPKAQAIKDLKPVAFVDDLAPFFRGITGDTHLALILGGSFGSPNVGQDLGRAHSVHPDLLGFAQTWTAL